MNKAYLFLALLFFTFKGSSQVLKSDNEDLNEAFKLAVNTVDINTRRGILAAGGDYGGEWVRDISINSWNCVSLIRPAIAEKSLWSVTVDKDSIGQQYWDKMIWTIAALNHYRVTGDRVFLQQAYKCSANTIRSLENYAYDKQYGLFTGPSVFNDGIAAYPVPIYDSTNRSSGVIAHKNSRYIKCLSTNCVYYGAYLAIAEMNKILKADKGAEDEYLLKAKKLKASILKNFYDPEQNKLYYLVDNDGVVDKSQEALGLSFAVIFNIVDKDAAQKIIANAKTSKYGITSIYPDFPRYSMQYPGRHNNIIWPMVTGFFAEAAIKTGNKQLFENQLTSLTHLALDPDKGNFNFREVYNPYTGKPDGGWQANNTPGEFHWASLNNQTWSATAYINMVLNGILGLKVEDNYLTLSPYLPAFIHNLVVTDLKYHEATISIHIIGKGSTISYCKINGKKVKTLFIGDDSKGAQDIIVYLKN